MSGSSTPDPRSLVCDSCWTNVINTQAYEDVCLRRRIGPGEEYFAFKYESTLTPNMWHESCSWCQIVRSIRSPWIAASKRKAYADEPISVRFAPIIGYPPYEETAYTVDVRSGFCYWSAGPLVLSAAADDLAAGHISTRPIQRNVSVETTATQLGSWLRDCEQHELCSIQADVKLPTRVIELNPRDSSVPPRLITTAGRRGRYATLSYCWGPRPHGLLSTSNLNEYMQRLPVDDLPQTVKDAISVAKAIPVDYLWIDALCILQDSAEDKAQEVGRMAQIYQQSILTIAAASSRDMTDGFLQMRRERPYPKEHHCEPGRVLTLPFRIAKGRFATVFLQCAICDFRHEDGQEPINERAWTLQEQAMAQRLLFYSSRTLRWSCPTLSCNLDDTPHILHGMSVTEFTKAPIDKAKALDHWYTLVGLTCHRKLTLSADKLPALAALAQQYNGVLGPGYFAGMWEYDFLRQLCWFELSYTSNYVAIAYDAVALDCEGNHVVRIPREYRAPTWSWASSPDIVCSNHGLGVPACEIVHVSTTLKHNNNPYGEIVDGHLILRGKLRDAFVIGQSNKRDDRPLVWANDVATSAASADLYYADRNPEEFVVICQLDSQRHDTLEPLEHWNETQPVKCILIYAKFGLLLREAMTDDDNTRSYRRVGTWYDRDSYPDSLNRHFSDVTVAEITIV